MRMCLSEFLHGLDFIGAKKSGDYVGTNVDNPAMILEENIASWTRITNLEDLQECFRVFEERVCLPDFPARYSPQFWLAHTALTTIYNVMSAYLETHFDDDLKKETDGLLFNLWIRLMNSGPGSSHLEMMDIILKYPHYPLWKYMQTLHGEDLQVLVSALKTDFVYKEEVSADHYATLMETHIDKVFKFILSSSQIEEARRELLDLYAFYLTRMNHVPPHIGPRLSHLCFLICQRYELENPYLGRDDWVALRNHLRVVKDIVTDRTFTLASEAQYRAPLTLEKIFQAVVEDRMLDIMFKDFMSLMLTICNHSNSKKCKRLFTAYQTALFEQIDFRKGFEETPNWMFDQCLQTLGKLSKTVNMETHIDEFIVSAQNLCLLKFTKLNSGQVSGWHELMVNYLVSGRTLLVREAVKLLSSPVLKGNNVLNWKTHEDQGRLLIDIVTDVPGAFIQANKEGNMQETVQEYVKFLQQLLSQMSELGIEGRVRQSVQKCLLKCIEKDPPLKCSISMACLDSAIPDLTDVNFIKDVLFSLDTLLKDERCPGCDVTFTKVVTRLLHACLQLYKSKGYIPVDVNSLLMSVCLTCMSSDDVTSQGNTDQLTKSCDMWMILYENIVLGYVELLLEKGTILSMSSLVPQVILAIQDSLQRSGTIPVRCTSFLSELGKRCFQLISGQMKKLLELFLDWKCYILSNLLVTSYGEQPGPFLAMFQDIFSKTLSIEHDDRHHGMTIVEHISDHHPELFTLSHTCQLLGTYSTETEKTKYHILNIILNIVKKSPGQVATYFSVLIDDTKFPAEAMEQKAPILQCLALHSDDLCQRCVDYLIKHVDNKLDSVSLVAMETLILLIKDKPGYIHKQKVRLKNVWRTSNNERVKQLCVQLLPEIKINTKKPAQKTTKNTSQPVVSKDSKKLVPSIKSNTRHQTQQQIRPATSESKALVSLSLASEPAPSALTKDKKLDDFEIKSQLQDSKTNEVKASVTPVCENNARGLTDRPIGSGDTVVNENEKSLLKTRNSEVSEEVSKILTVASEKIDSNIKHAEITNDIKNNSENFPTHKVDEGHGNHSTSVEMRKLEKPYTDIVITCKKRSTGIHTDGKGVHTDGKESIELCSGKDLQTAIIQREEKQIYEHVAEPAVCLCSCVKVKHLIERFGLKLKEAGFENIVKSVFEAETGNIFTNAKVVIVCLDGFQDPLDKRLMYEISDLVEKDRPVIVLKFQNVPWVPFVEAKLSEHESYIRLYSKPGENKIPDTDWPKYKFCEVLMQLSYYGVLPDKNLITDEFKDLWKTRCRPSYGDSSTSEGFLPDIFISYHWGKLRQVEPLYEYLTKEADFRCWFGAHQITGTESLYNKIQQGLLCCRVVLACVTSSYHLSEICQGDIRTAKHLDRPIIPLLIGDCKWPPAGKVGQMLNQYKPVRLDVTYEGCIDKKSKAMSNLVSWLRQSLNDSLEEKELEIPVEVDRYDETFIQRINVKTVNVKQSGGKNTVKKSSSLYEADQESLSKEGMLRRYSNIEDFKIKRRDLPDGVIVNDHGYSLKSPRSRSCHIL